MINFILLGGFLRAFPLRQIGITTLLMGLLLTSGYSQSKEMQHVFSKEIRVHVWGIPNSTERFTPTASEVALADSIAESYIRKNDEEYSWPRNFEYKSYYRQYVGYLDKKRGRVIFINSFCHPVKSWTQNIVSAKGGGSCYFSIRINLDSNDAFDLLINAPL